MGHCFQVQLGAVVLRPDCESAFPRGLVRTQIAGPIPEVCNFQDNLLFIQVLMWKLVVQEVHFKNHWFRSSTLNPSSIPRSCVALVGSHNFLGLSLSTSKARTLIPVLRTAVRIPEGRAGKVVSTVPGSQ